MLHTLRITKHWVSFIMSVVTLVFSLDALAAHHALEPYEYKIIKNIPYNVGDDADERHVLNLIVPKTEKPAPLYMWIPGGAWAIGNRDREMPIAIRLAEAGIAVAVIDHRMSSANWINPELPVAGATHPDHINDSARAFAWLSRNANKFGYDGDNLFVGGFSSGAHLSALLVLDQRYLKAAEVDHSRIRGAIPVSGAYDIERYYNALMKSDGWTKELADGHVLGVFGAPEALNGASPTTYLEHAIIPMLVLSEKETSSYTGWFRDAVEEAELTSLISFINYPNETHRSMFFGLQNDDREYPPRRAIIDFINEHVE